MPGMQVFDRSNFQGKFNSLLVGGATLNSASPVATNTLAIAAANITFSGIAGTYSVLRLLVIGASASAAESDRWLVTVNGTGGTSYDFQQVVGNNTSATASVRNGFSGWVTPTANPPGDMPAASATAGSAGILDITIPAYAGTTFNKVGTWRSGYSDGATAAADQSAINAVINWRSTAAVTSLTVATTTGSNLAAGTAAYLFAA